MSILEAMDDKCASVNDAQGENGPELTQESPLKVGNLEKTSVHPTPPPDDGPNDTEIPIMTKQTKTL